MFDLALLASIFMFCYQMFSRLIGYTQTFHQGILLLNASLMGGGLALLLYERSPTPAKRWAQQNLINIVSLSIALGFISFAVWQGFYAIFFTVSFTFGVLLLSLTLFLNARADKFYATEMMAGSLGSLVFLFLCTHYLEESIIAALSLFLIIVSIWRATPKRNRILALASVLANIAVFIACVLWPLPKLIQCDNGDYFKKSVCLDHKGLVPIASFPQLRGRSDLYQTSGAPRAGLRLRNNGFFVGASYKREDIDKIEVIPDEPRIPNLNLPPGTEIFDLGPSLGGRIQAFQKYIDHPKITAVELDTTLLDLYKLGSFDSLLPEKKSFSLQFEEGRRHLARSDALYDLIDVSVEEVNSPALSLHIDESTSLLFTVEAIKLYISRLRPNGTLLMEAFYPKTAFGDAMATKFVQGLFEAQEKDLDRFRENIILYSWDFGSNSLAQRFLAVTYKQDGFLDGELLAFQRWVQAMNENTNLRRHKNRKSINVLNLPRTAMTFQPFFSPVQYAQLKTAYNVDANRDDRPFRHQITRFPFESLHYVLYALLTLIFIFFLGLFGRKAKFSGRGWPAGMSAAAGIASFGLQYLVFYRTAAFLSTSLMQFSSFLILPLMFSGLGGILAFKFKLPGLTLKGGALVYAVFATALYSIDPSQASPAVLVLIVAGIFFSTGLIFPHILDLAEASQRLTVYAINIFCGGLSFSLLVTMHSYWGWDISFNLISAIVVFLFIVLSLNDYSNHRAFPFFEG